MEFSTNGFLKHENVISKNYINQIKLDEKEEEKKEKKKTKLFKDFDRLKINNVILNKICCIF